MCRDSFHCQIPDTLRTVFACVHRPLSLMKKAVKKGTNHNSARAIFAALFLVAPSLLPASADAADKPGSSAVWERAQSLGARYNLDPLLIFSVACAESSLDPSADSGVARGLMQMTEDAWGDVSPLPYRAAWDWQKNMDAASAYLARLRDNLEKNGRYTTANLVAAYHFGPGRLEKAGYDPSRLPAVKNLVYRDLLAGRAPTLPEPAPARTLEKAWRKPLPPDNKPARTGILPLPELPTLQVFADEPPAPATIASLPALPGLTLSEPEPSLDFSLPELLPPAPPDGNILYFGTLLHYDAAEGDTLLLPELDKTPEPGEPGDPLRTLPVLRSYPDSEPSDEDLDKPVDDTAPTPAEGAGAETPETEPRQDGGDEGGALPPLGDY